MKKNPFNSALLTDLYQLTMLHGYYDQGMEDTAVFEFFVRRLPPGRSFLVAAGLEQVLEYLESVSFSPEELDWLSRCGRFTKGFVDYLRELRFAGDVHAMPEGTVFFANEPILRVTAPMPQAQLVESRLINILHYQTLIASKAARCVLAAPDKLLVDFGMRRAHAGEAALFAARATYLAGFSGTATVLADPEFGIPIFGTMAHSFVQAHDSEAQAFLHFAQSQPENAVLLIDTYDTERAARKVVELALRLKDEGIHIKAVRLDSGDLAASAQSVRAILDAAGLVDTGIFCSGDLDEYRLQELLSKGAPIDGFGIGTRLDISTDVPSLDCVYKLQEYAGRARRKRSAGKATWPGRKQVYRYHDADGDMNHDVLTLMDDAQPGEALLQQVMERGRCLAAPAPLSELRARTQTELARLPSALTQLGTETAYAVTVSQRLRDLAADVDRHFQ